MGQCFTTEYDEQRRTIMNKNRCKRTIQKSHSSSSQEQPKKTCISEGDLRAYISKVFDKFNPNGDAYLEPSEVKLMIQQISKKRGKELNPNILQKYVNRFMELADTTGRGKVTKE